MKPPFLPVLLVGLLFSLPACGAKTPATLPCWELSAQRALVQGNKAYLKGCYGLAHQHYQAGFEGYTAADQERGAALALNNLGNAYRMLHQKEDALISYIESARRAARLGDQDLEYRALANRISLLLDLERPHEAMALMPDIPAAETHPGFIRPRARILHLQGKTDQAERLLREALVQATSSDKAGLYFSLGELLLSENSLQAAHQAFSQALELDRAAGRFSALAGDLMALARCETRLGRDEEALDAARRAMEIWALMGDTQLLAIHEAFFMTLAEKSAMDLTLSRHFIQLWQTGRAVAGPCD
ncbi:hypothetical protein [Desulfobotulus sp.]|jgi:tetratricopeptide (TPR) repeat protein|uniref:hypothetical protein n=1 Tax=Desulfobotulus sp. TaxID=1940337 RepID=UPI002A35B676|nr:hypothetical protein [Desulfobotulus sp.]MDY0163144.1 hypothetical protein [Desulfobotulus sp.]